MEARNQLWGGARVEKQKLSHDARTIIKVIITIVSLRIIIPILFLIPIIGGLGIYALYFMWTTWGKEPKKKE